MNYFSKFLIWVTAIGFSWEENHFFGWNSLPKSDAELIADGFQALLFLLAIWACASREEE